MATKPEQFRFRRGPISEEITLERMEALREGVIGARPAPFGHRGMKIRHTPQGWIADTDGGRSSTPRRFTGSVETTDNAAPTIAEMKTAVIGAFDSVIPHSGDIVLIESINHGDRIKFQYTIYRDSFTGTEDELSFEVTINSTICFAEGKQKGAW